MTKAASHLPVIRPPAPLERISIEVTNRCEKACWFCYNESGPRRSTTWTVDEIVQFVTDCAVPASGRPGVKAVSFGGGEPLQYDGIFEALARLSGRLFRSMTTNGLLLDAAMLDRLIEAAPEKVHVSIHFPGSEREVQRVIRQTHQLAERGVRSGINLLVERSKLDQAGAAAARIRAAGIGNDRIVYLPMRGQDTPTPSQIAWVAGDQPFQSMTCLTTCGRSPRFCSIGWDKRVAWCSYTVSRRPLVELSHRGLLAALDGLGLTFCGGREA